MIYAKMRLLASSGHRYFDSKLINDAKTVDYKSRFKVIEMAIDDFLKLALPLSRGANERKMEDIETLLISRKKFSSLPQLFFELKGTSAKVVGHEGRHRALALKGLGCKTMPVELRGPIRWSEQDDTGRFDYVETWPTKFISENGSFVINFPVAREQADKGYAPH
jgi:hypothetical protein